MGGKLFNSLDPDLDDDNSQQDSVDDLDEELSEQEEILDEELAEAEHRFNLGSYYRQLAKGGIFKDSSEAAKIVDAEVRAFARERMAVLLNLSTAPKPQAELPFNEDQIAVLQWLADRYREKQQQAASQPTVQSPAPPAKPLPPQAAKPSMPQVTPLAPPANAQAAPAKPRKKVPVAAAKQPAEEKVNYDLIADGVVFVEKNKHWKFVTNPETGVRIKMSVSLKNQVIPPHRRRMPTDQELIMISAQQAQMQTLNVPIIETEKTGNK